MPAPGTIFEKPVVAGVPPSPERLLILSTRTRLFYPFEATNWTDLRIGFFLSLTQVDAAQPDNPAPPMAEAFPEPPEGVPFTNCYFIGVLDRETGSTFFGFTNANAIRNMSRGISSLVSSDGGIGTTNSNFWRPKNSQSPPFALSVIDAGWRLGGGPYDGSQIHFPQVPASAGGYATLIAIRLQRADPTDRIITLTAKRDTVNHSGDIIFSNDPSSDNLKSHLDAFPATVQQLGPLEVSHVPSSLYLYWPFTLSRLRVHSLGLVKAA